MSLGQIGGDIDGFSEAGLRLAKRLAVAVKQTEVNLRLGVARIKLHSLLVMSLRQVGVAGFLVKQTKRKLQIRAAWRQFAGFLKAQIGLFQGAFDDPIKCLVDQRLGLVGGRFRIQAG